MPACVMDGGHCNGMCSDCPMIRYSEQLSERIWNLRDRIDEAFQFRDWDTVTILQEEMEALLDGE